MNRKKIAKSPVDLTRLKHCDSVRIDNSLWTVKYNKDGDYLLYRIYGEVELL